MARGSLPTPMIASSRSLLARSTETLLAFGLTAQTSLPSAERVIGLEVVGPPNPRRCALAGGGTASASTRDRQPTHRRPMARASRHRGARGKGRVAGAPGEL